jgi:hypothetical protein
MSDWSREAKIGLAGVLVTIFGIVAGILTFEIRQALGLPEASFALKPKYSEQIEIGDPLTVRRIKFARGSTSSVVTGAIGRTSEHDFLLGARSQQLMTVSLSSEGALFCVYAPDGSSLSEMGNAEWSGILPQSGDYRVKVFANGRDGDYRLEVSIR